MSMPDVVAKMPDKGESTRRAIEKQLAEKCVLEAEYNAKYAVSETFYTPQSSPKGSPPPETVASLAQSIDSFEM